MTRRLKEAWRISNLEIVTPKENVNHAIRNGLRGIPPSGEKCITAKLKTAEVELIRELCEAGESQTSVAKRFNVSKQTVNFVVNRKHWKHVA